MNISWVYIFLCYQFMHVFHTIILDVVNMLEYSFDIDGLEDNCCDGGGDEVPKGDKHMFDNFCVFVWMLCSGNICNVEYVRTTAKLFVLTKHIIYTCIIKLIDNKNECLVSIFGALCDFFNAKFIESKNNIDIFCIWNKDKIDGFIKTLLKHIKLYYMSRVYEKKDFELINNVFMLMNM